MKRLYICIALFAAMLLGGAVSMKSLTDAQQRIDAQLQEVIFSAEQGNLDAAYRRSVELQGIWSECEHHLMLMVRHNDLDNMTMLVNHLPNLARYESTAQLLSYAEVAQKLILHIWDSERFILRNIF